MPRLRRLLGAALAIGMVATCPSHPTVHAARPAFVSIWEPYWASTSGATRFASRPGLIDEVSPFFLSAVADGTVVDVGGGASMTQAIAAARSSGLRVIPTVTDGAGKGGMAAILGDPARRAGHIANLVNLVVGNGYDGVDLDYEQFAFTDGSATWATTMPVWVQFVAELSGALHAQGRSLVVTIPPVWQATTPGNAEHKNYWVYAQDQILPYVDKLRLMVYDWSPGTPSPNAPLDRYVNPVVNYSSMVADATGQPRAKLTLGVPAYGRHWRQSSDGRPCPDGAVGTSSVTQVAAANIDGTWSRDGASGELTMTWNETVTGIHTWSPVVVPPFVPPPGPPIPGVTPAVAGAPAIRIGPPPTVVTCTVRHTIWYPDEWSVGSKAQVALNAGWGGIVIWAGSYETTSTYDVLATL
jgi:spore germination protein YaaH